MAKRKRRSSRKLRPELILDARELENVVFQCDGDGCRCRIELTPDDKLPEGAVCPSCGASLDEERRLFKLYCDAYEELYRAPAVVRFRIARAGASRWPSSGEGPSGRRPPSGVVSR